MIYKNKGPPRSSVTILPWIKVVDEISDLRVAGNIDRISFVVLSCYYLFILKYDYCLIDCMPSLGIITVASLVAADRVLIPVQAQHFALKGLVSLFKSVNQVKRRINPRLDIDGIVLTMVDKRTNLSKDVCAALRSAYGHALKIYRAEIPVSTRTAESAASTHSVLTYDANGPASLAYKALAKEVTENERVRQQHQSALAR